MGVSPKGPIFSVYYSHSGVWGLGFEVREAGRKAEIFLRSPHYVAAIDYTPKPMLSEF